MEKKIIKVIFLNNHSSKSNPYSCDTLFILSLKQNMAF